MISGEAFNFRQGTLEGRWSLDTLNSLTKYPSIETYHALGAKGILREFVETDYPTGERQGIPPLARFVGAVEVTEKVDGTNARVIVLPDGTLIVGSREELLWASGDLIANPVLGIVSALREADVPLAAQNALSRPESVTVLYGEVYGYGVGGAGKRYSADRKGLTGFRVFDAATVPIEHLVWSPEVAANWRQHGGQHWESGTVVQTTADHLGVQRVPVGRVYGSEELPRTILDTARWLHLQAPYSRATLAAPEGKLVAAEGVVLRGFDVAGRRLLAKLRFEDYDRTVRECVKVVEASMKRSQPADVL